MALRPTALKIGLFDVRAFPSQKKAKRKRRSAGNRTRGQSMATTDVATTSLNVAGCFTRDSWLSCGEAWLTLAYKLFHRGGIEQSSKARRKARRHAKKQYRARACKCPCTGSSDPKTAKSALKALQKAGDRSSSVSTTGRQQSSRVLFRAVAAMA